MVVVTVWFVRNWDYSANFLEAIVIGAFSVQQAGYRCPSLVTTRTNSYELSPSISPSVSSRHPIKIHRYGAMIFARIPGRRGSFECLGRAVRESSRLV